MLQAAFRGARALVLSTGRKTSVTSSPSTNGRVKTKDSSVVRPREQVPSDAFIDMRALLRNHLGRGLCSVIANCDPDDRTGAYGRPETRLVQADDNARALPTTREGDHSGALAAESHGYVLGSDAFSSCVHYPRADSERLPPRISLDEEDGDDGKR